LGGNFEVGVGQGDSFAGSCQSPLLAPRIGRLSADDIGYGAAAVHFHRGRRSGETYGSPEDSHLQVIGGHDRKVCPSLVDLDLGPVQDL
jgi:hypothetical protein